MTKISGILTDGAGQVINDCTIELYAKKTTSKVLAQTQAFKVAENGSYIMNVLPCDYEVSLIINGFPKKRLGTIQVYSDSVDGSLNDYLLNPAEDEITPTILQQVFDARNETNKSASRAAESEKKIKISENNAVDASKLAKTSADNAKSSEEEASKTATAVKNSVDDAKKYAELSVGGANNAKTSADNAKKSADLANQSATNAKNLAQQSADNAIATKSSADAAKTSEQSAKKSAEDAKKAASSIDTTKFVNLFGDLSNKSLNTLHAASDGIYFQCRNVLATRENGYPINESGTLAVMKNYADGDGCCQIYITYRNARQFVRNYRASTKSWEPWIEQITTANASADIVGAIPAAKINLNNTTIYRVDSHVVFTDIIGDWRLMPFRRDELPFGWYFRNGDNYLLSSPQGQALNSLSANYKNDHRITIKTINGLQYINVPTAFAPDGRGFFERAVNGTTRQVGSWEDDAIRNIVGTYGNVVASYRGGSGAMYTYSSVAGVYRDGGAIGYHTTIAIDASRAVPTSNENRPLYMGFTPAIYLGV